MLAVIKLNYSLVINVLKNIMQRTIQGLLNNTDDF